MRVHDYTRRYWGHDYTFTPSADKKAGRAAGWGRGIQAGDFLLLEKAGNPDGKAKYRVDEITYLFDPPDMWRAQLTFVPRVFCDECHAEVDPAKTDEHECAPLLAASLIERNQAL